MADASDPRPILYSVLEDYLPCGDRSVIFDCSGLHAGWSRQSPAEFVFFWVEFFTRDAELVRRMRGAYHAIGRAFVKLERLHRATYGTHPEIPPALVDFVRREVLATWFETSREVLDFAEGATAEQAARDIKRLIGVEQWLREFE